MSKAPRGTIKNNFGKKICMELMKKRINHDEKDPEAEDDGAEEAYATHMEVDQEDQSHSDEEDDDSYE